MRTCSLVIALAILGCGGKKDEPHPTAAPATKLAALQIFVGDAVVGSVDAAKVASWPRLDSLVPASARRLGAWKSIATKGARTAELAKPFDTYRDFVPALFPGDGGTINFGMFDPVELGKRGKPAVREDAITELRVSLDTSGARGGNDHGGGEAIDPAKAELVIKTQAGEKKLTGEQLLGLPREAMPGGGGDATGWKLDTILAAAGVTSYSKVTLYDAGGSTLPLEKKDLDASAIPFIKLNRQGALRFRLYKKQGDGFQSAGDLRAVTKIDVEN